MTGFQRRTIKQLGWASLLWFTSLAVVVAQGPTTADGTTVHADQIVSPEGLAKISAEVAAIADSASLARAKKEKLISLAVRSAILSATRSLRTPGELVRAAVAVTVAAVETAPAFAEEIARAAAFAGPVSGIEGANAKIRAAAFVSAKRSPSARRGLAASETFSTTGGTVPGFAPADGSARAPSRSRDSDDPRWTAPGEAGGAGSTMGRNSAFAVTGAVNVSHESNIFLQSKNEVAETIVTVKPGVDLRFGQKSQAHGGLGYSMALTKYVENASTSTLNTGNAEFGFSNGSTSVDAAATYQEVEQGSRDTASLSGNTFTRRNIVALDVSAETSLTSKSSLQTGVKLDRTDYKQAGLLGSSNLTLPLKVFVDVTPKLAVSAGFSYDQVKTDGEGQDGHGSYYNVGLRGNLSEKLSSNFTVGYRTREVGDALSEGLWGFDGSFNLQVASKTNMALLLSRNFSNSASGETLTSAGYFYNLSTAPTVHWQFAGGLGYRTVDYGPKVFATVPAAAAASRADSYWELNLSATYAFTSWMNATLAWSHRKNNSNEADAEFANSVLSLMVGFRY